MLDRICVVLVTIGSVIVSFCGDSIMKFLDIQLSIAMVCLFVPLAMGVFFKPRNEYAGFLPMVFGFVFWGLRNMLEMFAFPMPETESYAMYPEFVYNAAGQGFWGGVCYAYAWIPADLQGLAMSFVAYFVGQWCFAAKPHGTHEFAGEREDEPEDGREQE